MLKQDAPKSLELLYKSFEFTPLAKMAVESGAIKTKKMKNTLQLLGVLVTSVSLKQFGLDIEVVAMDKKTAYYIRDSTTYSSVMRDIDDGLIQRYGHDLIHMKDAAQTLVASASAIATVQQTETGGIDTTRKKELGLEDKHGSDLLRDYHSLGGVTDEKTITDHEEHFMKEQLEKTPQLKRDEPPPLKQTGGGESNVRRKSWNPWNRRSSRSI